MQDVNIFDFRGKRVHMIGIGGSSMSGLAQMLSSKGFLVSGSDGMKSYTTDELQKEGIPVVIGHQASNVHGADVVVYSAAIAQDNPERLEIHRLGLPSMERATLLGQLMGHFAKSIAVCGTHGKTTTTAMLAQIFMEAGSDPTIHIGGKLDAIGGSTRVGQSDIFLAEACEFNASFLHMRPTIAVVLNIEEDHLDFYRDLEHITSTFGEFLALLPDEGTCIGFGDDSRITGLMDRLSCRLITFGYATHNTLFPENLTYDTTAHGEYDITFPDGQTAHVRMSVPGITSVTDSLACMATAYACGIPAQQAADSLHNFSGAKRRFEHTSTVQGVRLYHDYGHNPAEMKNVLATAKAQEHNRLWAVMQPHTYSRVKSLFAQYIDCCRDADEILITDIFAAREKDPGDIHATMLVDAIQKTGQSVHYTPTFDDTEAYLRAHWQPGDLVLTMGCGNINLLNDQIAAHEANSQGNEQP